MNGIKRSYTNPWVMAKKWLLNEGSDTTLGWRFLEIRRMTGGTAMLVLWSRLSP